MLEFPLRVQGIVHDHDGSKAKEGVRGDHHLGHVGQHKRHLVPLLDTESGQGIGKTIYLAIELAVGDLLAHHDQGYVVRVPLRHPFEGSRQGEVLILHARRDLRSVGLVPESFFHALIPPSEEW